MNSLEIINATIQVLIREVFTGIISRELLDIDDSTATAETVIHIHTQCCAFVESECAGRDESHGAVHMAMVTQRALEIFRQEQKYGDKLTFVDLINVVVGAMLHDVADHKYDPTNQLAEKVQNFIKQLCVENVNVFPELWTIINTLSFSKEKKAGGYEEIRQQHMLGFPVYIHRVRYIISDADRMEAIGKIGAERCIEYTKETNPMAPLSKLQENVGQHAKEKLYRLPFPWEEMNGYCFFHTRTGREMAVVHHLDTIKYVDEFLAKRE